MALAHQINIDVNESSANISVARGTRSQPIRNEPRSGHSFKADDLIIRLAETDRLQTKPDIGSLEFGKQFTDHMLKIFWHRNLGGWQRPEITPMENLVIHPGANVLHYAVELFEGLKAYRGVDGRIRLFRPDMNMKRMNLSAQRSGLPSFDGDEFLKCMAKLISTDKEWVPYSESASLYIRPNFIGTDANLTVASADSALLYIILSPVAGYLTKSGTSRGVSLLADPVYTRSWPGGVGDRKMGSNYAPTIHVQNEARSKGLQQVLWLYGPDHQITEVGTMNVFFLVISEQGAPYFPSALDHGPIGLYEEAPLPGITRDSILHLARQWNECKVTEATISMAQLCELIDKNRVLEIFGSGTASIVCPIERIQYLGTDLLIPTMKQESPMFARFRDKLLGIQYGKIDHHGP